MTRATPATPRTAAGRALLRICQREFDAGNAASAESYILAIEAEMDAGLDVDWHYCDLDSKHHQRAEAAQPAADGLDVERLADVLRVSPMHWEVRGSEGSWVMTRMFESADEAAEHIAAEYARLAAPPRPHDHRARKVRDEAADDMFYMEVERAESVISKEARPPRPHDEGG